MAEFVQKEHIWVQAHFIPLQQHLGQSLKQSAG
jgi:hypothetical protein